MSTQRPGGRPRTFDRNRFWDDLRFRAARPAPARSGRYVQAMNTEQGKLPAGTIGSGNIGAAGLDTQLEALSAQMEAGWERGRNAWAEYRANLSDSANRAVSAADQFVRQKPWAAISAALVGGLLLSALLRGGRNSGWDD